MKKLSPGLRISSILIALLMLAAPAHAQDNKALVLQVAQQVFDGINTKNGDLIQELMMPGAILIATFESEGLPDTNLSSAEDFAQSVAAAGPQFHERMFETNVLVQEGIAMLWATYDFHIDGEFSHCGVDTFMFVKTATGWKVGSLAYTVQRSGCAERDPIPENQK